MTTVAAASSLMLLTMVLLLNCCLSLPVSVNTKDWLIIDGSETDKELEELCRGMKVALECSFLWTGLSTNMRQGLLYADDDDDDDVDALPPVQHTPSDSESTPLSGLPDRPLYLELANRLLTIRRRNSSARTSTEQQPLFLPAAEFGFAEVLPPTPLPPPPSKSNAITCASWLRHAGESGIRHLLGFRTTIGSISSSTLLPPSHAQLLHAANKPHKPNAKPPRITVAARARAKHAHRGADSFFGKIEGGADRQNATAEDVLVRIIRQASWINVHVFGGTSEQMPILELRVGEGYGARWSADWSDPVKPKNVRFRGFLEPHMPDGHERRWRH